jgi:hypothetical protein
MGGILARADQWRDFEKRFTAVQSQYGFRVWHSKKFKKKAEDFRRDRRKMSGPLLVNDECDGVRAD